ncbi:MAG: FecR family protein [Paludibacter sp.]|nr:FecR family protein [Paludibacter sp.]
MDNYIKLLYKKFLYGRITRGEFLEMRHQFNSMSNDELNDLITEEWNQDIQTEVLADEDKKHIQEVLNFYIQHNPGKNNKKWFFRFAAVLIPFVILISSILIFYTPDTKLENDFVVSVKPGNRAQVTLPDKSTVWMNSNSKLIYSRGNNNSRNVQLTGEAFFKVYKDSSSPFFVNVKNLKIEVIGTSFNVNARLKSDIVETSLVEGSVKLSGDELSQDYYLKPNEKAVYSASKKLMTIEKTDNRVETAWKDNKLQFKSKSFDEVIKLIEEWYGVRIVSKCTNIEDDKMSGAFRGESLQIVLETVQLQYKIQFDIQSDSLIVLYN